MGDYMESKDSLRDLRLARSMKQAVMADLLGIKLRAYQNCEYGTGFPNFKSLMFLADDFDVSLDYLAASLQSL